MMNPTIFQSSTFTAFRYTPSPSLRPFVHTIWGVKGYTFYQREIVLPSGGFELMVSFAEPHRVLAVGEKPVLETHRRFWVAGLHNQPLAIESAGDSHVIGISFRPGGAHALLGRTLVGLLNQVVAADLLLGYEMNRLREQIAAAQDLLAQIEVIEQWLLSHLTPDEYAFCLVRRAIDTLDNTIGGMPIAQLCDQLGLSNKHLITLFQQVVGISPKNLARIMRFKHLVRQIRGETVVNWADVAYRFGYYDQSHLIQEFRALAGVTPQTYLQQRAPNSTAMIGQ